MVFHRAHSTIKKAFILCIICCIWRYFKSTVAMASVRQQTGTWLQIHTQSESSAGVQAAMCLAPPTNNFLGGRCDFRARSSRHLARWQQWGRLQSTNGEWPVERENGTLTASLSAEFSVLCNWKPSQRTYIVIKIGEDLRLCWSRLHKYNESSNKRSKWWEKAFWSLKTFNCLHLGGDHVLKIKQKTMDCQIRIWLWRPKQGMLLKSGLCW